MDAGMKRGLDGQKNPPAKRFSFGSGDLDLEALVSQLNQHAAAAENGDNDHALSLEEQLEGALASIQGGHDATAPPHHPQQPDQGADLAAALQEHEPPMPSEAYTSQLASQLNAQLTRRLAPPPAEPTPPKNSTLIGLRRRFLPILGSVAAQLLDILSAQHYQDVLNAVTQPDSDRGRAYNMIVDVFEETKHIFARSNQPFLLVEDLGFAATREAAISLQRANLATFCAAVFGSIPVGFMDLNKWFYRTFVPENNRLLKSQAGLFLDLKTQAYISAMSQKDKPLADVLDELFPKDLSETLLQGRDRTQMTPVEQDFVSRCANRRENIEGEDDQLVLANRYQWVYFLRDLSDYISKHHYTLLPLQQAKPAAASASTPAGGAAASTPTTTTTAAASAAGTTAEGSRATTEEPENGVASPSVAAPLAPGANPAQASSSSAGNSDGSPGPSAQLPVKTEESKRIRRELGEAAKAAQNSGQLMSEDTLAQYEAARSTAEPSTAPRSGRPSALARRSWTKQEEEALLKGLDKVHGPYWAQILGLYGPGGSISEVLKDRTQVQLKDKARNLKMFFVRCGLPIPAVFEYVTGDYDTRRGAGRRARARKRVEASPGTAPGMATGSGGPGEMPQAHAQPQQAQQAQPPVLPLPLSENMGGFKLPIDPSQGGGDTGGLQLPAPAPLHGTFPGGLQVPMGPAGSASSDHPLPPISGSSGDQNMPQLSGENTGGEAMLPAADALDRALNMLKENETDDNHLQHLIQSVGDYINNQQ